MSISLKEITIDNFEACVKLKVAEAQKNFVATNVMSIAQSKVEPHWIPLAVYNCEELVGFTLHGKDPESKSYFILRLMIDEKFQGNGFGKQATLRLIELMSEHTDCNEVYLFFVEGNKDAENLYLNIGFERTGVIDGDVEIEMRYQINKSDNEERTNNN